MKGVCVHPVLILWTWGTKAAVFHAQGVLHRHGSTKESIAHREVKLNVKNLGKCSHASSTSGWGDMLQKVSYVISSKLEKRYYPMKAGSSKTVACNSPQHIPAALQMLNPFSLGQHLLTTEVWEEVTSCFIAAVLFFSASKMLTLFHLIKKIWALRFISSLPN